MKKDDAPQISSRTSALAGAAALVSGMSVAAGAAVPEAASTAAAVDEEKLHQSGGHFAH